MGRLPQHPIMGMLFKPPKVKVPKAADPPPAPTIDTAMRDRNETNRARRRMGLRGNIAAGGLGLTLGPSNAAPKTLTGQ
jgi:hypothetical protein